MGICTRKHVWLCFKSCLYHTLYGTFIVCTTWVALPRRILTLSKNVQFQVINLREYMMDPHATEAKNLLRVSRREKATTYLWRKKASACLWSKKAPAFPKKSYLSVGDTKGSRHTWMNSALYVTLWKFAQGNLWGYASKHVYTTPGMVNL